MEWCFAGIRHLTRRNGFFPTTLIRLRHLLPLPRAKDLAPHPMRRGSERASRLTGTFAPPAELLPIIGRVTFKLSKNMNRQCGPTRRY